MPVSRINSRVWNIENVVKGDLREELGWEELTVQEVGWAGKQNGELLRLAETTFDALVTVDANLRYQQNLAGRKIAMVVLQSSSNRLDHLRQFFPACVEVLQ